MVTQKMFGSEFINFKNESVFFLNKLIVLNLKIESCNVYMVQVMKNESKINPRSSVESSSQLHATTSSSSIGIQKSYSLSLKPVLKYAFKSNGKLDETIKNDAKLMDEELPDTYGYISDYN